MNRLSRWIRFAAAGASITALAGAVHAQAPVPPNATVVASVGYGQVSSPANKETTQRVSRSYDVACKGTMATATVATGFQGTDCSVGVDDGDGGTSTCSNAPNAVANCYPQDATPPPPVGGKGGVGGGGASKAWATACIKNYEQATKQCAKLGGDVAVCLNGAKARVRTCEEAEATSQHQQPGTITPDPFANTDTARTPKKSADAAAIVVPSPPAPNDYCGGVEFKNMAYCAGFSKDNEQIFKSCLARTQEATALCRKENGPRHLPQ